MKKSLVGSIKGKYLPVLAIILILSISYFSFDYFSSRPPEKPESIPIGQYDYTIEYLNHQIHELSEDHDLPSVVVALIDNQDTIYKNATGLADIESNIPATLDTYYKMGSIAKVFTGLEIMRMYEEGLIDLDAPLTDYLPEFKINTLDIESGPITIRSLLSHHSGLPRNSTLLSWYWEARPYILKRQVESLAHAYQAFPVGKQYKYSNIGYNTLGYLIEEIRDIGPPSDESAGGWPYYMRDNILMPMGMTSSYFGSEALLYGTEPSHDVAIGYYQEDGKNIPYAQYDIIYLASSNLQSNMNDMISMMKHLFRIDSESDEGIIQNDTLSMMFEVQYQSPRNPNFMGLTWFTDRSLLDELIVFHSGTYQGVHSLMMFLPEHKLGFISFSNSDSYESLQHQLAFETLALMLETKTGVVAHMNEGEETAKDYIPSETKKYAGKYILNGDVVSIEEKNNKLTAIYQDRKIKLVPLSEDRFRPVHWLMDLDHIDFTFFVDDLGEDDILIVHMGDYSICPRYPDMDVIPSLWNDLTGTYTMYPRTPSIHSSEETLGRTEVFIEDGVLFLGNSMVLLPQSENILKIIGGVFANETMTRDGETGDITWQNIVYKKE